MSAGASGIWAIKPCVLAGWAFPGLPNPSNPNNLPIWEDLQDEIGRHIAQIVQRSTRRKLTAAVRAAADQANQRGIVALLNLAKELETP